MNIKTRLKAFILRKLLTEDELWMVNHAGGKFQQNARRLRAYMYPSVGRPFSFSDVKRACDWTYGAKRVAFSDEHDPESPMNGIYSSENPLLRLLKNRNQEGFASGGAVIDEPIEY